MSRPGLGAGETVAGRFEIEHEAGSGGMGTVYRAIDRSTNQPVALKLLHSESPADAVRFEREALTLAMLDHPGVVRYVSHGPLDRDRLYLALEWLEGEDLAARLDHAVLDVEQTLVLARRLSEALAEAHSKGVVHRDIKPSNVFLPGGNLAEAKLIDFGIARWIESARAATRTGHIIGTPQYMAPEQVKGVREVTPRADVFSLGSVLFECLTGRPVFVSDTMVGLLTKILLEEPRRVRELRGDVPLFLDALIVRMLSKDPMARPVDGGRLAQALGAPRDGAHTSDSSMLELPAITREEARFVCFVLAQTELGLDLEGTDATITPEVAQRVLDPIRLVAEADGAEVSVLANGCVVVTYEGVVSDQAARAARCALRIHEALPFAPVAVVTGRGEGAARAPVGEILERGARLLSPPAPGEHARVCIDDSSVTLLDQRFRIGGDERGLLLLGAREGAESPRTLLGKPTACVGRERELNLLWGVFEECLADSLVRAVLMTGPLGIGKSRIAHELRLRMLGQANSPEIWLSRSDPVSSTAPLGVLGQLVRAAAGIQEGEPLEGRRRKLRARVARWIAPENIDRVTVFLGEIIGTPFPEEANAPLTAARGDAQLMGDQIHRAWVDFVTAEASEKPLVMILEDLHWCDLPTVRLIDTTLEEVRDRPIFILALARPEVRTTFPDLWSHRDLHEERVAELSRKGAERLVRSVLADVDDATLERLVVQGSGNPLYLEELIRLAAEGRASSFPETVLAIVQARLDGLETDARRVLRAASVFGNTFWDQGVEALLGGTQGGVGLWLEGLSHAELVTRSPQGRFAAREEYAFRHPMIRETAYASLTGSDRTLGHRLAASWLERAGETDAMTLAEHYEKGGEQASSAAWYRRAAAQALAANDFDAAVVRSKRGEAQGASGTLLGALKQLQAEAHVLKGDSALAAESATAALRELGRGEAAWWAASGDLVVALYRRGEQEEVTRRGAELLEAVPASGADRAHVIVLLRAAVAVAFGNVSLAEAMVARAREAAAHVLDADPLLTGRLHFALAVLAQLGHGDPVECCKQMELAAESYDRAGDARNACSHRLNVGFAKLELGLFEEAADGLREAIRVADRMGLRHAACAARQNLGNALLGLGQLDEALSMATAACQELSSGGYSKMEVEGHVVISEIHLARRDLASAEAAALAAVKAAGENAPNRAAAHAQLAEVLLRRDRPEEGMSSARQAMAILEKQGVLEWREMAVRLSYARALRATGEYDMARAAIVDTRRRLLARAEKIGEPSLRRTFLARVPENAAALALANEWGVDAKAFVP